MRVAHLMAGARTGGAELFFERLAAAQRRAGAAVLPVIRHDAARAARLRSAGLSPVQAGFGGPFDLPTRWRLRRALARFRPGVAVAWMGRAAAAAPTGDWALVGRLGGYYDLSRFRRCHHLVANTRGLVRWIVDQGWPADRVRMLPNFVPDLRGAAPAALPVPDGAPIVLGLGRLHPNKGWDVLVRAMGRLPGAVLVLAGEGPERPALEELARREGADLRLLGWRQDTAALLAAATVLAVPSRSEPLGNVVLEGFSAEVPVVAAAAAGPAELIRDGETGLLVPVEDAAALAAALGLAIDDRDAARRLARAGRLEYEGHHAEGAVVRLWHDVLNQLAAERH